MPAQPSAPMIASLSRSRLPSSFAAAGAGLLVAAAVVQASTGLGLSRQRELTTLVRQDCGSCHGMTLNGGLGKPLTPGALADLQADSIAYIILEGVPGQPMPPWKGLITEEEARWIASRLKEGFPE